LHAKIQRIAVRNLLSSAKLDYRTRRAVFPQACESIVALSFNYFKFCHFLFPAPRFYGGRKSVESGGCAVVVAVEIVPEKVNFLTVEADRAGQRLDNFLLSKLKGLPRSRLYRLLRRGELRVNKGRVKPDYRLQAGDILRIPPLRLSVASDAVLPEALAERLKSSICHEDQEFIVVNKPPGLAVHGGSGLSWGLIEALRQLRTDCPSLELAHRLDRDTSGCLVVAKKRSALKRFHTALRDKWLNKQYTALALGCWPRGLDVVTAPLRKNTLQSGERMVVVAADGRPSETRFKLLQQYVDDSAADDVVEKVGDRLRYSLIEAMPITGRTHQIRVHARAAGHPLCGDSKYGDDAVNKSLRQRGARQLFLHASAIELPQEAGLLRVESPLPDSWQAFLATLSEG